MSVALPDDAFDFGSSEFLDSASAIPPRPRRAIGAAHGAARLAGRSDLRNWITPRPLHPHDTILPGFSPLCEDTPDGAGLRPIYNSSLVLPSEIRNRHVLGVGQPGSGKTSKLILPFLLSDIADLERTIVVFDPKCEIADLLAPLVDRIPGRRPLGVLNFSDAARSLRWNPVERTLSVARLHQIAHTLCHATENSGELSGDSAYWVNMSVRLVTALLRGLVADPREEPSVPRLHEILELPRDRFVAWCREIAAAEARAFADFLLSGSHNAETSLSDAQMRLQVFLDDGIRHVMSGSTLDFDDLVDAPSILVVEMDEARVPELRPLWNLFLTCLLDHLVDRAGGCEGRRLPRPVSLVIDEFASAVGRVPHLETRLHTMRSRNVSVTAAVQSLSQLQHVYGSGSGPVLAAFSTKLFFAGLDAADAEYASCLAGRTTVQDEVLEFREEPDGGLLAPSTRRTIVSVGRALLQPEEISRPPEHFALGAATTIFLPQTPPFQAWMTPAHRRRELAGRVSSARTGRAATTAAERKKTAAPRKRRPASPKPTRAHTKPPGIIPISRPLLEWLGSFMSGESVRPLQREICSHLRVDSRTGGVGFALESEDARRALGELVDRLATEAALHRRKRSVEREESARRQRGDAARQNDLPLDECE